MFTIILLHGTALLTEEEYKKFAKNGIIIGGNFKTKEIARFVSDDMMDALDMLKGYHNTCIKRNGMYDVSEYALLYCKADIDNEGDPMADNTTLME